MDNTAQLGWILSPGRALVPQSRTTLGSDLPQDRHPSGGSLASRGKGPAVFHHRGLLRSLPLCPTGSVSPPWTLGTEGLQQSQQPGEGALRFPSGEKWQRPTGTASNPHPHSAGLQGGSTSRGSLRPASPEAASEPGGTRFPQVLHRRLVRTRCACRGRDHGAACASQPCLLSAGRCMYVRTCVYAHG